MRSLLTIGLLLTVLLLHAQQDWMTRNGMAKIYSHTPLEEIKAENRQLLVQLSLEKGTIKAALLLKGFLFEKALMQEHFNENYVESDRYPKSGFEGNFEAFDPAGATGSRSVTVKGKLTLHGVTRDITVPATITVTGNVIEGKSEFHLKPEDFNIKIPGLVRDKIASDITVTISFVCKQP